MKKKETIDYNSVNPMHGYVYCTYCNKYVRSCNCKIHANLKLKGTCNKCRPKDFKKLEDFINEFIKENKIII